jgi:hypothetical protein
MTAEWVAPAQEAARARSPESRFNRPPINPASRCQCPLLQGSSEALNIRSQTVISALQHFFPVRK